MDSALKQRLLGAIVLIALAVIFVPMFLGSSPQQPDKTTLNLAIPNPPATDFQTRTLPVQVPATSSDNDKVVTVDTQAPVRPDARPEDSAVESSTSAPAPAPSSSKSSAAPATTPAPVTPPAATPVAPPPAVTAPASTTPGGRFAVHLGAYAERGGADALVTKLKKLGYAAYDEPAEYQGKPVRRVRVGPFESRAAAESARLQIKRAQPKIPSSVVETATAATTDAPPLPAGRAGGYAVQLGAFSTPADANKLRDRLRVAGFAGFVDTTGDGAQKLWRVRAGPYADRAGADKARNTIRQKFNIKNPLVVTLP